MSDALKTATIWKTLKAATDHRNHTQQEEGASYVSAIPRFYFAKPSEPDSISHALHELAASNFHNDFLDTILTGEELDGLWDVLCNNSILLERDARVSPSFLIECFSLWD